MAFRANEEENNGLQRAISKLIGTSIELSKREESRSVLGELIDRYGPVVESYPHWHPLVSAHNERSPVTTPGQNCGYQGLDHTIYLRHAIITCPYEDGADVYESVKKLAQNEKLSDVADISAEKIEAQLYHPNAHPILIKCEWLRPLNSDRTIPASLAVPLLLEKEVPCWRWAQAAETWKTMSPYILGRPSGTRSSLFVDQETGQILKDIWTALINTGMYGPILVASAR